MKLEERDENLHCANADKMYSGILADRVRELKHTQKGVERMCREMEQIYSEGEKRGIELGALEKARETAISLAGMGLPADKIAEAVKISEDVVKEWLDKAVQI